MPEIESLPESPESHVNRGFGLAKHLRPRYKPRSCEWSGLLGHAVAPQKLQPDNPYGIARQDLRTGQNVVPVPLSERKQMPKLKSKSGAKKRFSLTATGKVRANQAGKQHGMIKRTNKQIRNLRGTTILAPQDAKIIKKMLPYG
jgi:large subunit ribosomal protein L35